MTDIANDLYMTLFKVNKVSENYLTVSFLYFCAPLTHSLNEVIMDIKPPGCNKVSVAWMKKCGDALSKCL